MLLSLMSVVVLTMLIMSDRVKSKPGNIVSRKKHTTGMKAYVLTDGWTDAAQKARKDLGV